VGNLATGHDGHTGMRVDAVTIAHLDTQEPFAYCRTFAEKYQSSCISQLLKILMSGVDPEQWINICLDPTFNEQEKAICTNMMANVYMRNELSFAESATLPMIINEFPKELRRIAMMGVLETFNGYFADNALKEWRPFCEGFRDNTDVTYCIELFEKTIAEGSDPWMELDIR
jgi:hypothetical protein